LRGNTLSAGAVFGAVVAADERRLLLTTKPLPQCFYYQSMTYRNFTREIQKITRKTAPRPPKQKTAKQKGHRSLGDPLNFLAPAVGIEPTTN
jgi:hypothetical protein